MGSLRKFTPAELETRYGQARLPTSFAMPVPGPDDMEGWGALMTWLGASKSWHLNSEKGVDLFDAKGKKRASAVPGDWLVRETNGRVNVLRTAEAARATTPKAGAEDLVGDLRTAERRAAFLKVLRQSAVQRAGEMIVSVEDLERLIGAAQQQTGEFAKIEALRADEGDSVTILCENPEGNGFNNNAVVVSGTWTGDNDLRFEGHTLLEALTAACEARAKKTKAP